jgi:hypothetical protein
MELVLERQALAKLGPLPEGGPLGRVTRGGDADAQIRSLTAINRARLTEEPVQDMVNQPVILLLKAGMGDPRHHGELLVRVW